MTLEDDNLIALDASGFVDGQGVFEIMKGHTTIGRETIRRAEQHMGTSVHFLQVAQEMAFSHHEKWDGTGYPQELSGDDIPISARLMAVADVYDALISRRVYREAMPQDKVVQIVTEGRGLHFDPHVIDAFIELQDKFREIASRHADPDPA